MKAVLALPAWWKKNPRHSGLSSPGFAAILDRDITNSLRKSTALSRELPAIFPVEIEWVPDHANPKSVSSLLAVRIEGIRQNPVTIDLNAVIRRSCTA